MIFMWQTPKAKFYYPTHPFSVFSDAQDLATKVLENNYVLPSLLKENIWAENWQENYQDYLDTVLQ